MIANKTVDILLVEDDAEDAELTLMALKQRNITGKVVHVMDGDEALDFIYSTSLYGNWDAESAPKVILLDLNLTKVGGMEVLRELKTEERTKSIPVVVMTATKDEAKIVESYKLGVNSFVVKPTDLKEYRQVVGDIGNYWLTINQAPHH
jgi:two-component system, response regulator